MPAGMKAGLPALCKRGLSSRAATLRAVLRKALCRGTGPKQKCCSKTHENWSV